MKLKEIPQNIAVHTPTEAEAKELLAILHETGYGVLPSLKNLKMVNGYKDDEICFNIDDVNWGHGTREWYEMKGFTILTFSEFKRMYCEKDRPQPKFAKGQRVYCRPYGYPFVIADVIIYDNNEPHYYSDNGGCYKESILEPYTEPETKPTEDMETKELNLCELLHEGDTVYSLINGEGEIKEIDEYSLYINGWYYNNDGTIQGSDAPKSYCLVFPSRALYEQYPLDAAKAWSVWQKTQKRTVHLGVKCYFNDYVGYINNEDNNLLDENIYFRTPADRDKCLGEIKAIIEKYSK